MARRARATYRVDERPRRSSPSYRKANESMTYRVSAKSSTGTVTSEQDTAHAAIVQATEFLDRLGEIGRKFNSNRNA
jgi:hypothetical protein